MEWGRVKSIMIGVFFVVNVFLFTHFLQETKTSFNIRTEVIDNTVLVLSDNNISIEPSIIPRKMQNIRIFDIINKFETPKAAAAAFWEAAQIEGMDFFNPEFVTVDDNSFKYVDAQYDKTKVFDENSALSITKKIIADLKLSNNISLNNEIINNDDGYSVIYTPIFEGLKILDCYLKFEINSYGLTIYGYNWLGGDITSSGMSPILPVTEVLLNFAVSGLKKNISIDNIKFGYYLGSRQGKINTVTAVPSWEIKTSDDYCFYYDAGNGDLLEWGFAYLLIIPNYYTREVFCLKMINVFYWRNSTYL